MDCLHRAPLWKLARYVRGVYQFDKYRVTKWAAKNDQLKRHPPTTEPRPIMALHSDNAIKQGHEPAHRAFTLSNGSPIQLGLEKCTDTLEPESTKTMVVFECP